MFIFPFKIKMDLDGALLYWIVVWVYEGKLDVFCGTVYCIHFLLLLYCFVFSVIIVCHILYCFYCAVFKFCDLP